MCWAFAFASGHDLSQGPGIESPAGEGGGCSAGRLLLPPPIMLFLSNKIKKKKGKEKKKEDNPFVSNLRLRC